MSSTATAPRVMFDGIDSDAEVIPTNAELVAGYVDGDYVWSAADWDRFPGSTHIGIAVRSTTNAGIVLDVETGNATPEEAVNWVLTRRHAGADPTIYCGEAAWPSVRSAFQNHDVTEPHYWVAAYDGDPAIPTGAIAKQYRSTATWDESVVADYWPGVDPAPAPTAVTPAPPAAPAIEEDDMQQIEPTSQHPGEYAYGVPAGKTKVAFVADGYSDPPAKLRVVTWVGDACQVHDSIGLGGVAPQHYATVPLPSGTNAVTVHREDASEFPVGVYLI